MTYSSSLLSTILFLCCAMCKIPVNKSTCHLWAANSKLVFRHYIHTLLQKIRNKYTNRNPAYFLTIIIVVLLPSSSLYYEVHNTENVCIVYRSYAIPCTHHFKPAWQVKELETGLLADADHHCLLRVCKLRCSSKERAFLIPPSLSFIWAAKCQNNEAID